VLLAMSSDGFHRDLVIWFVLCVTLGVASVVMLKVVSSRARTGPPSVQPVEISDPGSMVIRLVGGANVPTSTMRVNASYPLGVMEVYERAVRVSIRPRLFGAVPLFAGPRDLDSAFPVRGAFRTRGVGLRLTDGREWYFWTGQVDQALQTLADHEFPVSHEERRASKIWQARPWLRGGSRAVANRRYFHPVGDSLGR
jgi:hypothetical protein